MFKRFVVMMLVILTASVFIAPVQAAGSPWTTWLYEGDIGRMTQVDSSGTTLNQFQLPADAGSGYSRNVAVSADGLLIGYAAFTEGATTVSIYDIATNTVFYNYTLPGNTTTTSLDFNANAFNFSDGNSTFAFGYATMEVGSQVVVIDVVTLSSVTLKESDVPLTGLPASKGFLLPVVTYNRNQQVKFSMIPLGTDGVSALDAYVWNTGETTIAPENSYVVFGTDTLPLTSEVVMAVSDPRFPESVDPVIGYPSNNTLQVYTPSTGQRFVVIGIPRIYLPRFVQGGERVALVRYNDNPDGIQTQELYVVDRSGALAGVVIGAPLNNISSIIGTLNGFIFTAGSGGEAGGTTLYYVETRLVSAPYTALSTWNSSLGANGSLVWSSDSNPAGAGPFAAWGQLSPPLVQPTPAPPVAVGDSAYAVGIQAEVQTTDNDVLNLRSGPGVSFTRLGIVKDGTLVTLIEGPQNADGFTWWRVRLPTGVEGWVVSAADGVNTLLPR